MERLPRGGDSPNNALRQSFDEFLGVALFSECPPKSISNTCLADPAQLVLLLERDKIIENRLENTSKPFLRARFGQLGLTFRRELKLYTPRHLLCKGLR